MLITAAKGHVALTVGHRVFRLGIPRSAPYMLSINWPFNYTWHAPSKKPVKVDLLDYIVGASERHLEFRNDGNEPVYWNDRVFMPGVCIWKRGPFVTQCTIGYIATDDKGPDFCRGETAAEATEALKKVDALLYRLTQVGFTFKSK